MNMAIWWDGDTGRELFDGQSNPSVSKITASGVAPNRNYSASSLITFSGTATNSTTKANPCLQADILGDWREEVLLRVNGDNALRIYTTTMPTVHTGKGAVPASGIPSLMQNKEYRLSIAWQHTGYNQPPHTDFYLGYEMADVQRDSLPPIWETGEEPEEPQPTGIQRIAQAQLSLYPNPVTSGLLTVIALQNASRIDIYNLSGALVATYRAEGERTTINVSHLPKGVYLLRRGGYAVKFIKK